jgi:hypothetical protein
VVLLVCSVPLALSGWAMLDTAHRPEWVWALTGRRRVAWLAAILFGAVVVPVGLVVSSIYLVRVRPELADAETGRLWREPGAGPGSGSGPNSSGGGGP